MRNPPVLVYIHSTHIILYSLQTYMLCVFWLQTTEEEPPGVVDRPPSSHSPPPAEEEYNRQEEGETHADELLETYVHNSTQTVNCHVIPNVMFHVLR